jgi:malonyl-CoA/methylmalonyl-CoA synthetase
VRVQIPAGQWPQRPVAPHRSLPEAWVQQWDVRPRRPVLIDGWDRTRVVDGATLQARTAALGGALEAYGVGRGDRVVWSARATGASVEALLAIVRASAVLVPLNPSSSAAEAHHVVTDAGAALVVCDHERPEGFGPGVTSVHVDELQRAASSGGSGAGAHTSPEPSDDALIVYTSGTTGRPKGAVHTHASLHAGVTSLQTAWEWHDDDCLILCLPLFHVHGLCAGLFGALAAGGSVVLFDRFDEDAVLTTAALAADPSPAAEERRPTMFFGVPTMYHRLAATGRAGALAGLRLCVSGSAPLAADLWHRLANEGVPVLERYGMTETLLTLSNPVHGERRAGSVGVPLPGVEASVEGADALGVGELLVRGAGLCRGYWGREAWPPGKWFATGDLVSVADDGYVTIRGRRTDLIITGGHNVYPAEVEAVLARHPGVDEVAVVGVASAEWGETVVAFVVGDADPDELRAFAAAELASFKCPREVRLVGHLPRNALCKVVRGELR